MLATVETVRSAVVSWPDPRGGVRVVMTRVRLPNYGDASEELARFAADVDLLIVGSRGAGPLGRLINGSTSTRLAGHSSRPLLVMPRCLTADAART
jgi:nucleotide-binding universal stress UspA family protein